MQGVAESWRRRGANSDRQEEFSEILKWIVWYWKEVENEFEEDFPAL